MKHFNTIACALTLLAAGVLSACGESDQTKAPAAAPAAAAASAAVAASTINAADAKQAQSLAAGATLGVTVADYQKNFDRIMKLSKSPYRANFKPKAQDARSDGYEAVLNDNLTIMITVDKQSQKIVNVLMHGASDGTEQTDADILVVGLGALASALPGGTLDQVGPDFTRLVKAFQPGDDTPVSRTLNGVKFSHTRSHDAGVFFAAQPA
ncbi:hypothetical protein [Burkholderia stagnalis]